MSATQPNPGQAKFEVKELEQVGIIVRDLQKSMENYWNNFGIGPWTIFHYPSSELRDMTYRGKAGRFSFQIARGTVGAMEVELIEPLEGESTWADFLKEHGEGVHHIAWYKVDNMAETIQSMEKAGFLCLTSARTYRAHFAYFDTTKLLGTILEAFWADESIPFRPTRIWPE